MKAVDLRLCILLLVMSLSAFGFASPDFTGTWIQDSERSDPMTAAPDTMVVKQSDSRLDVESIGGQNAAPREIRTPFGSVKRKGVAKTQLTYLLDGQEHSVANENGNSRTYRATVNGGQLVIESNNSTNTPFGPAVRKVKEEWSLSPDGTTLTIETSTESAMGRQTQKRVYTKQP